MGKEVVGGKGRDLPWLEFKFLHKTWHTFLGHPRGSVPSRLGHSIRVE